MMYEIDQLQKQYKDAINNPKKPKTWGFFN